MEIGQNSTLIHSFPPPPSLLKNHLIGEPSVEVGGQPKPIFFTPSLYCASVLLKKQQQNKMPTFVPVSEEILDDRNGCNTQKNPLEINKVFIVQYINERSFYVTIDTETGVD